MEENTQQNIQPTPPFDEKNDKTPEIGGGLPVVQFWAEHTLSPEGPKLWKTLFVATVGWVGSMKPVYAVNVSSAIARPLQSQ